MNLSTQLTGDGAAVPSPVWLRALALSGLAWNLYGIYQFIRSFSLTPENMMAVGMTAEQAEIYLGLPAWMSIVFAIGVFGGALGCVLLLLRRSSAMPVFAVSLAGYVALFAGDAAYGVFENMPAQFAIMILVVTIAAALSAAAWIARRGGFIAP